jgi:hypothetical protein
VEAVLLFLLDDLLKELAFLEELGDQEHALLGLDDLVELQDVAVPHCAQDGDFVLDPSHVFPTHALLVDEFHRHLLAGRQVHRQVDFAEGALADGLA